MIYFDIELIEFKNNSRRIWLCKTKGSFFDLTVLQLNKQDSDSIVRIENVETFDDQQEYCIPTNEMTDASGAVDWWALARYILRKLKNQLDTINLNYQHKKTICQIKK